MRTAKQTIEAFCSQLAAGTPAPGGGAAAAVAGAMGASLVAMAAGLTVGREKFAAVSEEMAALQEAGKRQTDALLQCADEDQAAFSQVMAAFALPKGTPEEKAKRREAVWEGYKAAIRSPLKEMEHCLVVMRSALTAAQRGNPNARGDAYVGYRLASAAFDGALWNAAVNLESLKDEAFQQEVEAEVRRLQAERTAVDEAFRALAPETVRKLLGNP